MEILYRVYTIINGIIDYWYQDDKLHCDNDEPAKECSNGKWIENGLRHFHRDEPADINIAKWYLEGIGYFHRDEPADINLAKWCLEGIGYFHRDDDIVNVILDNDDNDYYIVDVDVNDDNDDNKILIDQPLAEDKINRITSNVTKYDKSIHPECVHIV